MRVQQRVTIELEGDDIAALRQLLSYLPEHARGAMVLTYPMNQPAVPPEAVKVLAQRLASVVSGGV